MKIGPHIIGSFSHMLDTIEQWQPAVALVMDPSPDSILALRKRVPDITIIGRIFIPDAQVESLIRSIGWQAAGKIAIDHDLLGKMRSMPNVDFWQVNNEILQRFPSDIELLSDFSCAWMDIIRRYTSDLGDQTRAAIGGFSVGQPHIPSSYPMQYWDAFDSALSMAASDGHLLLLHAYGAPTMDQPSPGWYLHRFEERVWPNLPSGIKGTLRYVYGEYGIDGGAMGASTAKQGWRLFTDSKGYMGQIAQAEIRLREFPACLGACLFTCGRFGDWESFDIWPEVAKMIANWSRDNPYMEKPEPEQPISELAELAEACRWYSEEITRLVEGGNTELARRLLIEILTPNLYALEDRLKGIAPPA